MKKCCMLLLLTTSITFPQAPVEKNLVALTGHMFKDAKKADKNTMLAIAAMLDLLVYDKQRGAFDADYIAQVKRLEELFRSTYGIAWDKVDFSGLPIYQKIQLQITTHREACESDKTIIEIRLKNAVAKSLEYLNEVNLDKKKLEKIAEDVADALTVLSKTHATFEKAFHQYEAMFSNADKASLNKAAKDYSDANDHMKTIAQVALNVVVDLENKRLTAMSTFYKELSADTAREQPAAAQKAKRLPSQEEIKELMHAISEGNVEKVKELIVDHGIDVNVTSDEKTYYYRTSPLSEALWVCYHPDSQAIVETLVMEGAYLNDKKVGQPALHQAVWTVYGRPCSWQQNKGNFEALLKHGANPQIDYKNQTPLEYAIYLYNTTLKGGPLTHGQFISSADERAKAQAEFENRKSQLIETIILLEPFAQKTSERIALKEFAQQILPFAVCSYRTALVSLALKYDTLLNYQDDEVAYELDPQARTIKQPIQLSKVAALHCAVKNCNLEMVQSFLSLGANPNVKAEYGRTPLHFAALWPCRNREDTTAITKFLLEHGADKNAQESERWLKAQMNKTALELAKEQDNTAFIDAYK